jgi:TPR repeat protein
MGMFLHDIYLMYTLYKIMIFCEEENNNSDDDNDIINTSPESKGDIKLTGEDQNQLGLDCDKKGDKNTAIKYFRLAVKKGVSSAKFNLGCKLYEKDNKEDRKEGISWFIQAAKDGHSKAYYYLGILLEKKKDMSLAKTCYIQSAKYGCREAEIALVDMGMNMEEEEEKKVLTNNNTLADKIFEESTYE